MKNLMYWLLIVSILIIMVACGKGMHNIQESNEYKLITVSCTTAVITNKYSATIRGRQDVDILPQVSGKIVRLCVKEGQRIKRGQVLFVIDPIHYRAELLSAKAAQYSALTQVKAAELDLKSKRELYDKKVVSKYTLTAAVNAVESARAGYEQASAQRINAANSLSYTIVKSPVNGVVGTLPYKVGTLVNEQLSKPLTTVSDNSQIYVYFSISENELRSLIKRYGSMEKIIKQMPSISLEMSDGTIYSHKGHIETISGIIDFQTGTISVRGVFVNPEHSLLSGGIGNIILNSYKDNAIIIPQEAVFEIQDKAFVYRVIKGKAVLTSVKIQDINDGKHYIVIQGLKATDIIIGSGVNSVKEGMNIRNKVR